jgi:hypothetical protein
VTLDLRITPGYIPTVAREAMMAEITVPGYEDSLWLGVYAPCMICRRETTWVELNFEGPLCTGECTYQMWREYWEANRNQLNGRNR